MKDFREQDFYELLDLKPQASQQEIEQSYERARRFFSPDSVATYALFQVEELSLLRRRIEEAYRVLGTQESRRRYDLELLRFEKGHQEPPADAPVAPASAPVMEAEPAPSGGESVPAPVATAPSIPVAPTPAVESPVSAPAAGVPVLVEEDILSVAAESVPPADEAESGAPPAEGSIEPVEEKSTAPVADEGSSPAGSQDSGPPPVELPLIGPETVVTGALLAQARQARGLTIEQIAEKSKINIFYLRCLENETFGDLPAPVYVRGYLRLVAQLLGLDPARVASSYMERMGNDSHRTRGSGPG